MSKNMTRRGKLKSPPPICIARALEVIQTGRVGLFPNDVLKRDLIIISTAAENSLVCYEFPANVKI
jgi:hypothetical protein